MNASCPCRRNTLGLAFFYILALRLSDKTENLKYQIRNECIVRQEMETKPRSAFKYRRPGLGDVLVLRRSEETLCYFLDSIGMALIHGFFSEPASSSGTILMPETTGYAIQGKAGLWSVVDTISIEQSMFFLMENEKYGKHANRIILGASGEIVMDDNKNDFDDEAIQRIQHFLHHESLEVPATAEQKPALELYQRYYENGEYERAASFENQEEQNYNMIDGTFNNRRSNQRPSVRKRLQEKLALIQGRKDDERVRRR